MRIRQCICGLKQFKKRLMGKYSLVQFNNQNEPAIAFGLYNQHLVDIILRTNAMVVIVWSGTDAYDFCFRPKTLNYNGLLQKKNVRHIAISKWVSNDLSKRGIPHICLPVNVASIDIKKFEPVPLGTKIYTYSFSRRPNLYGRQMIDAVKKKLPDIEFIDNLTEGFNLQYTPNEMPKIYEQCFMGLRPTLHDGCSNTVIELGLMGRKCIHNGWIPGSISWYGVDDIVANIRHEQTKIGTVNKSLAKQIVKYIDVPYDWLYTEFYK